MASGCERENIDRVRMTLTCVPERPHDRVNDWLQELARVCEAAASLPQTAQVAVLAVVGAFEQEDGVISPEAARARALLTASAHETA